MIRRPKGAHSQFVRCYRERELSSAVAERGWSGGRREATSKHVQPLLRTPDSEFALRRPARHWELDKQGQPTQQIIESRRRAEFITPIPKPKKRKGKDGPSRNSSSTKAEGFRPRSNSTIRPARSSTRFASYVDEWRQLPNPKPLAGHARNRAPAPALAASPVQRRSPVLLPGRSRRDRHLADRGRAESKTGKALPRASGQRQQGRQPRADAPRPEAGHRRGQDHGHGHAHRVADDQRRPPARQQQFHPRLSGRLARPDHQRPPARPPAERSGQLLRKTANWCPATCSTM